MFQQRLGYRPFSGSNVGPCSSRPRPASVLLHRRPDDRFHASIPLQHPAAASSSVFGAADGDAAGQPPAQPQQDFKPFPRLRERDPYRLLGLGKDAGFEEIQDARNYLYEMYRWHEPSREAIELAFDTLIQEKLKARHKFGFQPVRMGRRGFIGSVRAGWDKKIYDLFDPTITIRTLINEGAVFALLGLWAMFSSDQLFPLAGAFAYSVYKFQQKRVKRDPEGPFFGGNPIVGAILNTVVNFGLACALMSALSTPLAPVLGASVRQVGALMVVLIVGVLNVYLK